MKNYIFYSLLLVFFFGFEAWGQVNTDSLTAPKDTLQNNSDTVITKIKPAPNKENNPNIITITNQQATIDTLRRQKSALEKKSKSLNNEIETLKQEIKNFKKPQSETSTNSNKSNNHENESENDINSFFLVLVLSPFAAILLFYSLNPEFFKQKLHSFLKNKMPKTPSDNTKNLATTDPKPVATIPKTTTVEIVQSIINFQKDRYFHSEVMVTAGPRKNFQENPKDGDYGLGEDVAGFVCIKDVVYFWVFDGTSDNARLLIPNPKKPEEKKEIFSSRLLAQSIAWNIQAQLRKHPFPEQNAAALLKAAIDSTASEWEIQLNNLQSISAEQNLKAIIAQQHNLQCSTTALFGILNLDGNLNACLIGDSTIVTYPKQKTVPTSKSRQFVSILLDSNEHIKVSFNEPQYENIEASGIDTVIAMSDGISANIQRWIQETAINFTDKNSRKTLANQKPQTQDDKAICIVQIKQLE